MEETEIKEKILSGAQQLFMKYGIRSVSMDDISRHLAISKKTLYQYFADKDELVTLVAKAHLAGQKVRYESIEQQSENAIDELHQIAVCLRHDMQEMSPTVLHDIQKFHSKAWNVFEDYKNDVIHASVVRNIKQGIEDGHFRSDINPDVMAALRLANIEMCFNEKIFPHSKFSIAEVQSQVFEHFIYGLCTEKGKKLYLKYKEDHNLQTIPK